MGRKITGPLEMIGGGDGAGVRHENTREEKEEMRTGRR